MDKEKFKRIILENEDVGLSTLFQTTFLRSAVLNSIGVI